MRLGFTGTEAGMTTTQAHSLWSLLQFLKPSEFHHGMCEGADEEAHGLVRELVAERLIPNCFLIGHPGVKKDGKEWKRGNCPGLTEVWPAVPFLARNLDIPRVTEMMVAAPGEFEEIVRSGTWSTVRRARGLERPIDFVYPDGTITSERLAFGRLSIPQVLFDHE